MSDPSLAEKAGAYLTRLCLEVPTRRTGTAGNRAATDFFAATVRAFGWQVECRPFACLDWSEEGASLAIGGQPWPVQVSPFSPGGFAIAPLAVATTVDEIEAGNLSGSVLLLRGDVAREQLMPKEFPFYNPDEHKRIVRALEEARPQAIVAATGRNPELAGAVYPFPLIEDGDFAIPSVYTTDVAGEKMAELAGQVVELEIRARRTVAEGCNVVARKGGGSGRRALLFAHIDAKDGTPGALDNASGIAVLLLLAELLSGYDSSLEVEMVAMNGEDYYAASGEKAWLTQNEGHYAEICLGTNLDGVGHRGGRTAYSLYGCGPALASRVREVLGRTPSMVEGEPWYQSDHSLFLMLGIPALAFTSQQFNELWSEVAHTAGDRPEIVDPAQLVSIALSLRDLLSSLAGDR